MRYVLRTAGAIVRSRFGDPLAMSMIEIQQRYIDRVAAAHAKQGRRSAGLMFARTKGAARKEATAALLKCGYTAEQAAAIVKDAHDVFILERDARCA
jgi:hypothetical protein